MSPDLGVNRRRGYCARSFVGLSAYLRNRMNRLQLTLESPAANLALDEALLTAADAGESTGVVRIWESSDYVVVLGRSSDAQREVKLDACQRDGVPVMRRSSGGATVLIGPGCLMYAVVMPTDGAEGMTQIDRVHDEALGRIAASLAPRVHGVVRAGTSDLALDVGDGGLPRKFSGNSLRVKRRYLLYHGTLLYEFELSRVGRWLSWPARQPKYRAGRSHSDFVVNLPLSRAALEECLIDAWQANVALDDWPRERTQQLARNYRTL
jgi:lipoate-protein ligase A